MYYEDMSSVAHDLFSVINSRLSRLVNVYKGGAVVEENKEQGYHQGAYSLGDVYKDCLEKGNYEVGRKLYKTETFLVKITKGTIKDSNFKKGTQILMFVL